MTANLVLIKGAGDIASGIALRLRHSGFNVVMTELARPTTVRRSAAFSRAVTEGETVVEDVRAMRAASPEEARKIAFSGIVAVLVDEAAPQALHPKFLVDAVMAKRNTGTRIEDAPVVIAAGPGFVAGFDCHAVVETARGHTLGRVYYVRSEERSALANTGIPGEIAGFSVERLIRSPGDGIWHPVAWIGRRVEKGELVAELEPAGKGGVKTAVLAEIPGIVRGMLPEGFLVRQGMKCGDIDPRCEAWHCRTVSDKALAVAGGVLEAILALCTELPGESLPKSGQAVKLGTGGVAAGKAGPGFFARCVSFASR